MEREKKREKARHQQREHEKEQFCLFVFDGKSFLFIFLQSFHVGVIGCQTSGAGRYFHTKWGVFRGTFIVNLMYLNLPRI